MGINSRIKEIEDHFLGKERGSSKKFADTIGVSRQAVTNLCTEGYSVGINSLLKILSSFPNINANWLLLGKGDMLIGSEAPSNTDHEIEILKKYLKFSKDTIDKLRSTISQLEDEIIKLKAENAVLKGDKTMRRKDGSA